MKNQLNFLSLQIEYWDETWQNRHAFLWELSKIHKVLFLNPPFYIAPLLNKKLPQRTQMSSGLHIIKENLFCYLYPRFLPYNYRYEKVESVINFFRTKLLRQIIKKINLFNPIIFIWHPSFYPIIEQFPNSPVIYYKYDNFSGFFDGTNQPNTQEIKLINRADFFFVTSQGLYDMHINERPDLHLIPNAVDYEHFENSIKFSSKIPNEISSIPSPRIGYVGVINEKVDCGLLTMLCKSHPEWSFILIGPIKIKQKKFINKLNELKQQPNCFFLGRKDGRQIPHYLKGLDVGLMCYHINDWTYYGYPLKMHEYLACGKPTVSSDLPAVREFSEYVYIAHNLQEWEHYISKALSNINDSSNQEALMNVAKANSWSVRVNKVMGILANSSINL